MEAIVVTGTISGLDKTSVPTIEEACVTREVARRPTQKRKQLSVVRSTQNKQKKLDKKQAIGIFFIVSSVRVH